MNRRRTWIGVGAMMLVGISVYTIIKTDASTSRSQVSTQLTLPAPGSEPRPATPDPTRIPEASIPSSTVSDPRLPPRDTNGGILGVLPDGTAYTLLAEPGWGSERIERISAAIAIDLPDGSSPVIGITVFDVQPALVSALQGNTFVLSAPPWTVTIDLYDEVLEELGPDPGRVLTSGIQATTVRGLPVLTLEPPFRWVGDMEIPLQMQVVYGSFVVQRECGDLAAACSQTNAVQIIPADRVFAPAPAWSERLVWVESRAPRPESDQHYLDPGPLEPRGGHSVIWTGEEMIVWGGATGDRPPHLLDGAAFDPTTSTWRMLPAAPLDAPQHTHAVWTDDQMIVVGRHSTVAYDPASNSWQSIGDGIALPLSPDLVTWTGSRVVVWGPAGISVMDPDIGKWTTLPDLERGSGERWLGSLHVDDGDLIAVGIDSYRCTNPHIARWAGSDWEELPFVSLATDALAGCSLANQSAAFDDHLLVWEDRDHPTMAFDFAAREWSEVDTIPLSGSEGAQGAVMLGDRLLVPQWGSAVVLSSIDGPWSTVFDLPGSGDDTDLVWTGTELLMWGATCCYGAGDTPFRIDAWRWTPPGSFDTD